MLLVLSLVELAFVLLESMMEVPFRAEIYTSILAGEILCNRWSIPMAAPAGIIGFLDRRQKWSHEHLRADTHNEW